MVDGVGTTKYAYFAGGQLQSGDGPWANDTVTNGYSNRLRTSLGLQQPTGIWTNKYLAPGPALVARLSLPNGAYITNTFDNVARLLTNKLNNSSQTTLDSYGYIYNPANQRTNLTRADSSYYGFGYDKIGQLTDKGVNP